VFYVDIKLGDDIKIAFSLRQKPGNVVISEQKSRISKNRLPRIVGYQSMNPTSVLNVCVPALVDKKEERCTRRKRNLCEARTPKQVDS
jgi:hypothetical protein